MGNQDNWTTPKQIKIEREGEPRGVRRGKLKKGERKKGKKARLDEILSAKKEAERYRRYIWDDSARRLEHPEWYRPIKGPYHRYEPNYQEWFDAASLKLNLLLVRAVTDGVIDRDEIEQYQVYLCVQ